MDTNSHQTPGLDLPRPATGDGGFVSGGPSGATPLAAQFAANGQAQAGTSHPAGDNSPDTLDQEWVERAKDIVEKTKGDPFIESREISKVKAAYLKVRYNKDIKVHEDTA